jgi:hypothetical protein
MEQAVALLILMEQLFQFLRHGQSIAAFVFPQYDLDRCSQPELVLVAEFFIEK